MSISRRKRVIGNKRVIGKKKSKTGAVQKKAAARPVRAARKRPASAKATRIPRSSLRASSIPDPGAVFDALTRFGTVALMLPAEELRLWVGYEALVIGPGGVAVMAAATGWRRRSVQLAVNDFTELMASENLTEKLDRQLLKARKERALRLSRDA